jgi:hypothetical protein
MTRKKYTIDELVSITTMLKYTKNFIFDMMNPCPECGSEKIRNSSAEILCQHCGLVIEESVFVGQ